MTLRFAALALLGPLALAACGQTGSDPAVTSAPASASNAPTPDPNAPAGAPANSAGGTATQSYQQDTAEPADAIAATPPPPADDLLAHCRELDTAQRGDCELQARQGLDVQQSGVLDPVPQQQTPPTDRVPTDATAAQDDDERD